MDTPGTLIERADTLRGGGQLVDAEAAARWGILLAASGAEQSSARCALARCLIDQRRMLEARATIAPVEGVEAGDHRGLVHVSGTEFQKLMAGAPHGDISRHVQSAR